MTLIREAVKDVAAVELPNRQQIQRRRKKAEPRGATNRIEKQPPYWSIGMKQRGKNAYERRNSQQQVGALGGRHDVRRRHSVRNRGNRRDESCDRTRDPHVEKRAPRRKRRANTNERSESAEEIRRREKHGIAHIDFVQLARDIVSHFVSEKNSKQREREGNSEQQQAAVHERLPDHRERIIDVGNRQLIIGIGGCELRADGKRGENRQQKHDYRRPKRTLGR